MCYVNCKIFIFAMDLLLLLIPYSAICPKELLTQWFKLSFRVQSFIMSSLICITTNWSVVMLSNRVENFFQMPPYRMKMRWTRYFSPNRWSPTGKQQILFRLLMQPKIRNWPYLSIQFFFFFFKFINFIIKDPLPSQGYGLAFGKILRDVKK